MKNRATIDDGTEAQEGEKYIARLRKGMRQRIKAVAKEQGFPSMNSWIVHHLQKSLDRPTALRTLAPPMLIDEIEQRAEAAGVEFQTMLNAVLAAGLRPDASQVLYISVAPGSTVEQIRAALDAVRDTIPASAPIFIEHQSKE